MRKIAYWFALCKADIYPIMLSEGHIKERERERNTVGWLCLVGYIDGVLVAMGYEKRHLSRTHGEDVPYVLVDQAWTHSIVESS